MARAYALAERGIAAERAEPAPARVSAIPSLALLAGLITPAEMGASFGASLTPGRVGIMLLFLPATAALIGRAGRKLLFTDLLALSAAGWIVGAAIAVDGASAILRAPGGESLELFGAYWIARAYFNGPAARDAFMRMLCAVAVVLILLAVAEFATKHLLVNDAFAKLRGGASAMLRAVFRNGMLRAEATFDHPILFGMFCAFISAPLMYWRQSPFRRALLALVCLAGVIASITSAALLAFAMSLGLYALDALMRPFAWRWGLVWGVALAAFCSLFVVANDPLGWLVTHLTLDPESGYFRFLIWQEAVPLISQQPLTGYAYHKFNSVILDASIDSVWLVTSIRYGLPAAAFLALANLAACAPLPARLRAAVPPEAARLSTGFSIALMLFLFGGLTVHYWNFLWIFWGVCLGLRASLREEALTGAFAADPFAEPEASHAAA